MSRIGRKAIAVPSGVTVTLDNRVITVKGPKGTLTRELHKDMKVNVAENEITVERPSDHKLHRSLHGTTRSVIANMVSGVTEGFTKSLDLVGVGYRANKTGDKLVLNVGYSHPVEITPESGIEFEVGGQMLAGKLSIYQLKRFDCFLDPWQDPQNWCYQQVQAEMAFGHGGIGGVGFGQSIQKLFYLPEAQNDYIFAIVGEELGLIGSVLFLLLYLAFLWRGIIVSLRCPDTFGTLVGIGIVGMFGIQAIINIGGVIRAIPMTGITLPFISYGGSSMLVSLLSMGLLLSISRDQAKRLEKSDVNKQSRRRIPEQIPLIRN